MGRTVAFAVLVVVTMVAQVTVVNRLPLPGQAAPDLVLLAVVGYALARGALPGAVAGFATGLLSDVLPPVAHLFGHNALVFCVVGFVAGRAARGRPGAEPLVALACAAAGPMIAMATGALVGDPRSDPSVIMTALPPAVVYNLFAAPPVVWAVRRLVRGPEPQPLHLRGYVLRGRA
ncbi:rod shape-determining protein MreD [Streptosporangium sp. NPDC023615]|uniref:rod shape-determining protein MreD n=1 Tax=Streptosporangium sp. NPDC023615 TaxID=3154794 RepID=UPI00343BBD58